MLNSFFEPLKKEKYKTDKNSIFLHFHNIRALTPANYNRTRTKIRKIIVEKKDIKKIVENYDEFIHFTNKPNRRYFLDSLIEHYRNEKMTGVKLSNYKSFEDLLEDRDMVYKTIKRGSETEQKKEKNTCQLKENPL